MPTLNQRVSLCDVCSSSLRKVESSSSSSSIGSRYSRARAAVYQKLGSSTQRRVCCSSPLEQLSRCGKSNYFARNHFHFALRASSYLLFQGVLVLFILAFFLCSMLLPRRFHPTNTFVPESHTHKHKRECHGRFSTYS